MTCRALFAAMLLAVSACATPAGSGGLLPPAYSGGAPGAPCNAAVQQQGCNLQPGPAYIRVQCTNGTWTLVETCGAGQICLETTVPGSPGKIATCEAQGQGGGTDTVGADGAGGDGAGGDSASTDTVGSDAPGSDGASLDDTADASAEDTTAEDVVASPDATDAWSTDVGDTWSSDTGSSDTWNGASDAWTGDDSWSSDTWNGGDTWSSGDTWNGSDSWSSDTWSSDVADSWNNDAWWSGDATDTWTPDVSDSWSGWDAWDSWQGETTSDGWSADGWVDSGWTDATPVDVGFPDDVGNSPGCAGKCGGASYEKSGQTCYCDDQCAKLGDCCQDKAFYCP